MPLPSLEKIIPIFDLTIPSTDETLKFRPFLVKEEKLLLIALDGNDEKQMLDAIVRVVESCAISPIRVEDLSNFDLEYIFLQLRAKSVSEIVELAYRCHNKTELSDEEYEKRNRRKRQEGDVSMGDCNALVKIPVKLDTVQVSSGPNHSKTIYITDTMGLNMRYPNFAMAKKLLSTKAKKGDADASLTISDAITSIALCIESVFDEESVYSNFQLPEITSWIEKLTQLQFGKIQEFFETMPKLQHDVNFLCPECGHTQVIHIEGLPSFFG